MVIWCTWLCDIHFMACDCQCGISSVGICIGMVYDCLIFTVWYVNAVSLLIPGGVSGYSVYTVM